MAFFLTPVVLPVGSFVRFVRDLFILTVVLYGYEKTQRLFRINFAGCYRFPHTVT